MLKLTCIALMTASCGLVPNGDHIRYKAAEVDPRLFKTMAAELSGHIDGYTESTGITGGIVEAFPEDIDSRAAGVCSIWGKGQYKEITILKSWWDKADATAREQVVLHEFGHCGLGRDHEDTLDAAGLPTSIMHYMAFGTRALVNFRNNHAEFLNELFSK